MLEQPDQGCGGDPSPGVFQAPSLEVSNGQAEQSGPVEVVPAHSRGWNQIILKFSSEPNHSTNP